jgi:hypothetical protein
MEEAMRDHQDEDLYPIQPRSVRFFDWVPADKRQLVVKLMEEIAREEASIGADTLPCGCSKFIEAALRLSARAAKFANSSEALEGFHCDGVVHGDECTAQRPENPDLFVTGALVATGRGEFQGL